jgi:hypothetical protein
MEARTMKRDDNNKSVCAMVKPLQCSFSQNVQSQSRIQHKRSVSPYARNTSPNVFQNVSTISGIKAKAPGNLKNKSNPAQKKLTLKQAKDMMADIMISKEKFNAQCDKDKLPHCTLAQHVQCYFTRRYGLKHICAEMKNSMWLAIEEFSDEVEVKLFGQILENKIDEQFWKVILHAKETLQTLTGHYLQKKY